MITLSAIDGVGKTTQVDAVVNRLRNRGFNPVVTREPGGTPVAEQLRSMVLNGHEIDPVTEMMLVFTARHDHLATVIEPALAAGRRVVSDRSTDCTWAYPVRGRGLDPPALTFLLDIDAVTAGRRRSGRPDAAAPDRFERQDIEFCERVRTRYLERMTHEPGRFRLIDAMQSASMVTAEILCGLDEFVCRVTDPGR